MAQDIDLDLVEARAMILAGEDRRMRKDLVALRREAGLTQQDVATFMGTTQQAVQKLERYDADPQLSTLRRYANAVGALVQHTVSPDNGRSLWMTVHGHVETSVKSSLTVPVAKQTAKRSALPTYGANSKSTDFSLAA